MDEEFENQFDDESSDLNEEVEDFGPTDFDDYDEGGKKWLPKNLLMWGIALMWSFFIVFVFMYFIVHKRNQNSFDLFQNQSVVDVDSTMNVDSLAMAPVDSNSIHEISLGDTVKGNGYYVPPEGFLTVEDHMQILKMENGRRKREIDFLWSELRNLKKQAADIEQMSQELDSLKLVEPKTIVVQDTTPSIEEKKLEQELEAKKEQARLAKLEQEKIERDKALANSAKIYSSMKPKQAATILADFDSETAAQMLMKIRERQAAKILEAMEPGKATQICKYMVQ